jgi:cell division protein FtsA
MSEHTKDLIVALDIGTSKVVAMIAEVLPNNQFNVVGIGHHPSRGLKKGMVVNIEDTIQTIQYAIEEAELRAGFSIRSVCTGIAGSHIHSFNSSGMVAVRDTEITSVDIERVLETARAVSIPADQQVLHVIPQQYKVNEQDGIRDPIGMTGMRLEVKVHIITGSVSAAQNIVKCIRRCGLDVSDLVLQPLASSMAVLTEDERDIGVALVDIGGGTTDIAIFVDGAIRHTAVIPIAGDQVTNDIAMALRTPTAEAEELKLRFGVTKQVMVPPDSVIEIPGVGDRVSRRVKRQLLASVIEPRVEELFVLVQRNLEEAGFSDLIASGIVLTGGTSLLPGMTELAEEVFMKPVRIAQPVYDGNLSDIVCNPRYSTVVGLLIQARKLKSTTNSEAASPKKRRNMGAPTEEAVSQHTERKTHDGTEKSIFNKMKEWFMKTF